jgi:hypothetical protein
MMAVCNYLKTAGMCCRSASRYTCANVAIILQWIGIEASHRLWYPICIHELLSLTLGSNYFTPDK